VGSELMQCAPALGHKYYSVYAGRENYGHSDGAKIFGNASRGESMINKSNRRARQTGMIVICWDFRFVYKRHGRRGERTRMAGGKRTLAN